MASWTSLAMRKRSRVRASSSRAAISRRRRTRTLSAKNAKARYSPTAFAAPSAPWLGRTMGNSATACATSHATAAAPGSTMGAWAATMAKSAPSKCAISRSANESASADCKSKAARRTTSRDRREVATTKAHANVTYRATQSRARPKFTSEGAVANRVHVGLPTTSHTVRPTHRSGRARPGSTYSSIAAPYYERSAWSTSQKPAAENDRAAAEGFYFGSGRASSLLVGPRWCAVRTRASQRSGMDSPLAAAASG